MPLPLVPPLPNDPVIDNIPLPLYAEPIEVRFNPNLQEKLTRLASEQGCDSESLVIEAVERLVNYDEWFLQEVEKGLAATDRGEFVDHQDVKKLIDRRYPG